MKPQDHNVLTAFRIYSYDHKMINAFIKYQVLRIVTVGFFHCHQNQLVLLHHNHPLN